MPKQIKTAWVEMICQRCGVVFAARTSNVSRGKMKFCSRECASCAQRKSEPVEFAGDAFYIDSHGYYMSKRTNRALHRVVWEANHGLIPKGGKIYLKDGVRSHYALENLLLKERRTQTICQEEGCGQAIHARSLCKKHYGRLRAMERGGWD